jgi:hypothetical protein
VNPTQVKTRPVGAFLSRLVLTVLPNHNALGHVLPWPYLVSLTMVVLSRVLPRNLCCVFFCSPPPIHKQLVLNGLSFDRVLSCRRDFVFCLLFLGLVL